MNLAKSSLGDSDGVDAKTQIPSTFSTEKIKTWNNLSNKAGLLWIDLVVHVSIASNVTCLDFTLSNGFCQNQNPGLLDRLCTLSIVPTYAILEVILKMEIIMENKFVKKQHLRG